MAGLNKIEDYLMDLGFSYEEIAPNTWLVEDAAKGIPATAISWTDPVVVVRADVMPAPKAGREEFFAKLLELNGGQLLHGAYALVGEEIVLIDTLEYATMDKSEFEASLDAIGFALTEHFPILSRYLKN